MVEKRKLVRKHAPEILAVYDRNTDLLMGQIVNMTTEGILLLSNSPIPLNAVFQFRMPFPEPVDAETSVDFGVESLWDSPANEDDKFWTGFQIIDISDRAFQLINLLIADWAD